MNETPLFRTRSGVVIVAVVGVLLVAGLAQSARNPTPTDGPAGSSYATHPNGVAALVDLLEANDYDIARERRSLAEHPPIPDDTLVIINGRQLVPEDESAIVAHLAAGGRVVTIGTTWLNAIVESAPGRFVDSTSPSRGLIPIAGFDAVTQANSSWVWEEPGSLLPVVGSDEGTLVGIETIGTGIIVAIADARIASNDGLQNADNALLALSAIGEPTATVRFVEYIHGFTQPTGLTALPTRWKQALVILAVAGALWLVARGRRFGPPEAAARNLPPPRSAYVDALALTLASTKDRSVTRPLDEAIRRELIRRGADAGSLSDMVDTAVRSGADRDLARQALTAASTGDSAEAKAGLLSQIINKETL